MAKVDIDDNNLQALLTKPRRSTSGNTVQSRAKREKHVKPNDGRRHRPSSTEPTEALNVDVPPHIKKMAVQAKVEFGLTMRAFVADAIERHYAHLQLEMQSEPD